ncbi:MAG: 50S ribosomal protein L24 [bacterium]|nr:50S ribosomal protein L24 [bacterium]MDE0289906.1 50S ribosomal protein L24 [bacterium]MDE0439027.1 50S ribosomal protein L24 [bacterium]
MAVREGDRVMVVSGKDRGRQSRVARVIPKQGKVVVENINTAKRHQKARGRTIQAGIVDKDMPIDISNVMLVCEECGPVRVRAGFSETGRKYRRCAKCGGEV